VVYIAEAHANDVWPLGKHIDLPSHETLEDRIKASDILIKQFGCTIPMLYDTMADEFDKAFAVWPERYYIMQNKTMAEVFSPTIEFGFDREKMYDVLCSFYAGTASAVTPVY